MNHSSFGIKGVKLKAIGAGIICMSLLLTGLIGCGSLKDGSDTDVDPEGAFTASTDEGSIAINEGDMITIGFAQVGAESDWRLASTDSIEKAFSLEHGYHLIYEDGQQRQENQTKAIREFIDQDVDYIILDPIVETGWEASLEEAREAGIPVIVVDRRITVEDESLYTAWIGADFKLEGQRACEWLSQYILAMGRRYAAEAAEKNEAEAENGEEESSWEEDGSNEAGAGDVNASNETNDTGDAEAEISADTLYGFNIDENGGLIPVNEGEEASILLPFPGIGIVDIQGTLGASAQIGRSGALFEAVEKHPEWTLLAADTGDFVQAKGREVAEAMLLEYGDAINVMYCENDNMAYGAIEAIRASGRTPGMDIANGEIMVISFDATRQGLLYTLDGVIGVDTECTPDYGPRLSQMIQTLERGGELPKETYVTEEQFSSHHDVHFVRVEGSNYKVTILNDEIMDGRTY
ncbi:MAG: ABC transporter substrate-binding protein [Lachnospiraceae bacterium]|nr:ABC transporter substrate-binding protein [Lachnospiraceae bacterium]